MAEKRILVIEHNFRERIEITRFLEEIGCKVDGLQEGTSAEFFIADRDFILVIADIGAPDFPALDFMKKVKDTKPFTEVVFISEHPLVEDAVSLMKHGALDFFVKPVSLEQIELCLKKISSVSRHVLNRDDGSGNRDARLQPSSGIEIVTSDRGMQRVLHLAKRVADSTASVLIQGESGTGKELVARLIHQNSRRSNMPFVALNCAALPENLLESELFGYEKGAFTGAVSRKEGKFELANRGTLFLDEITEMQYHLQSKLLRVVQEKTVDRLGGTGSVEVDVRIIASTNRDIKDSIRNGEFREDLYHRLNTIPLTIPPLRQRTGDLKLLCDHFIKKYSIIDARDVKGMTPEAYKILLSQKFTGNVRELQNMIHRAVLLAETDMIQPGDLLMDEFYDDADEKRNDDNKTGNDNDIITPADSIQPKTAEGAPYAVESGSLRDIEERVIYNTLERTEGNRTHAARLLGISVRTLRNKLNEYRKKK